MKTYRKFLRLVALFALVLLLMAPAFLEAEASVSWELSSDGVLIISGTGDMTGAPWLEHATKIKKVVIQEGVTSICDSAFSGCTNLTELELPLSLKRIGFFPFASCNSLKSVFLPAGVEEIRGNAFQFAKNLERIEVSPENAFFASDSFGVLYNKDITILLVAPEGLTGTYRIEDSVLSVGGTYAYGIPFSDGYQILENDIKETYPAFFGCEKLTEIEISDGVEVIGPQAFRQCLGLKQVILPSSVTELGEYAFQNCDGLETIHFGTGLDYIGRYCFNELDALKNVTVPGTVRWIDEYAFGNCPALEKVILEDGISRIGKGAFITCPNLKEVKLPSTLRIISDSLFRNCEKLINVTIPVEVQILEDLAFDNIMDLETITFEGSAPRFAETVFGDINFEIRYPQGDQTWDSLIGTNAGTYSVIVWTPYVLEQKPVVPLYMVDWGYVEDAYSETACSWEHFSDGLVVYSGKGVICDNSAYHSLYRDEVKKLVIQEGIVGIDYASFNHYAMLEEVILPDTLRTISNEAFYKCPSLISIQIPAAVENIAWDAFAFCENLERIDVAADNAHYFSDRGVVYNKEKTMLMLAPEGFTGDYQILDGTVFIGGVNSNCQNYYGFRGCGKLTAVEIPESVEFLAESAFQFCDGLVKVELPDTVTEIGKQAFYGCDGLGELCLGTGIAFIPDDCFNGCGALKEIQIPGTVSIMGERAFANCGSLEKAVLENGVLDIRAYTFFNCQKLTEVQLPNSASWVSRNMFMDCTALESITIPGSVTVIGESAFSHCAGLRKVTFQGGTPSMTSDVFPEKEIEFCYPEGDESWEALVGTNAGLLATITWTPYVKTCEDGHTWLNATCNTPETCEFCGQTQGEPLGHTWVEATCDSAKICSVCGATEGETLGHQYENGTCVRCGAAEAVGLMGDVDGDGMLSYNDALTVLRASIGLATLTTEQEALADFDGDGGLSYNDALMILRASIGL